METLSGHRRSDTPARRALLGRQHCWRSFREWLLSREAKTVGWRCQEIFDARNKGVWPGRRSLCARGDAVGDGIRVMCI